MFARALVSFRRLAAIVWTAGVVACGAPSAAVTGSGPSHAHGPTASPSDPGLPSAAAPSDAEHALETGAARGGVADASARIGGSATRTKPTDTATVWKVPVGRSPVRGKPTALVTLVMFGDFACPYCRKAHATLLALERRYGDKLRLVYKDNPLSCHKQAEPAGELAFEALAQKGEVAFWKAFDLLLDPDTSLADADLEAHAKTLGLDVARAKKAIASRQHAKRVEDDQDLAQDLDARGTPTFFINGRRLNGSQPISKFEALIDDEIVRAGKVVAAGTAPARVYDALQNDATVGPPLERILVPAPTKDQPAKGARAGARVTIQVFADLQCPACKEVLPTLDQVIAAYPGKVRVVWRHLPSLHEQAQLAAEAATEAFRQKGDAGFWGFVAALNEPGPDAGRSRERIVRAAKSVGLDTVKLEAALDAGAHRAAVTADKELAKRLRVTGTPVFAINDYFLSGAPSLRTFKRRVERALGPYEIPAPGSLHGANRAPAATACRAADATDANLLGAKHLLVMYAGSRRAAAHITRTRAEAQARAEQALSWARLGESFEQLVSTYSDEPGAAERGGDLGTFPPNAMVREFTDALVKLRSCEISGVVETPFGFHVIFRTQ